MGSRPDVRQNMMRPLQAAILTIPIAAMVSCVNSARESHTWTTSLREDFQSAPAIMHEFDRGRMEVLRQRLVLRMREEGDERFASVLGEQSNEVQTDVCNVMGMLEEPEFDGFPRTRYALSAAPKI